MIAVVGMVCPRWPSEVGNAMCGLIADEPSDYISLDPFQEIVGELQTIECSGEMIYLRLSTGTIRYHESSREAEICQQALIDREGDRIGILRTASSETPLVVTVDE